MSKNRKKQRTSRPRSNNLRPKLIKSTNKFIRRDSSFVAKRSLPDNLALRSSRRGFLDQSPVISRSLAHPDSFGNSVRSAISFSLPPALKVCARRQERKEVLHALNKTGKAGNQKRPRFTDNSLITC